MPHKVTIDFTAMDPRNNEFVLYLVETEPWDCKILKQRLYALQERLYNTIDVIVKGILAESYPDSKGMRIRIEVDLHDNPPEDMVEFIERFRTHIESNSEYQAAIATGPYVNHLRLVTGFEMGRQSATYRTRWRCEKEQISKEADETR